MNKFSKQELRDKFYQDYLYDKIVTHYDIGKTNISVSRDISLWNPSKTPILFSKGVL